MFPLNPFSSLLYLYNKIRIAMGRLPRSLSEKLSDPCQSPLHQNKEFRENCGSNNNAGPSDSHNIVPHARTLILQPSIRNQAHSHSPYRHCSHCVSLEGSPANFASDPPPPLMSLFPSLMSNPHISSAA